MTDLAPPGLDAAAWVRRWDQQQAGYVPDREETFALMLDVLERLWEHALRAAGFAEIATLTQVMDRRLLVAIRQTGSPVQGR